MNVCITSGFCTTYRQPILVPVTLNIFFSGITLILNDSIMSEKYIEKWFKARFIEIMHVVSIMKNLTYHDQTAWNIKKIGKPSHSRTISIQYFTETDHGYLQNLSEGTENIMTISVLVLQLCLALYTFTQINNAYGKKFPRIISSYKVFDVVLCSMLYFSVSFPWCEFY